MGRTACCDKASYSSDAKQSIAPRNDPSAPPDDTITEDCLKQAADLYEGVPCVKMGFTYIDE